MNPILSNLTLSYPIDLADFIGINNPLELLYETIRTENNYGPEILITFDDIVNEFKKPFYCVSVRYSEPNDLLLIYYDELKYETLKTKDITIPSYVNNFHHMCKSCIFVKSTLQYIGGQHNKLIYGDDAMKLLKDDLSNVTIQKCYEGTSIVAFYHGTSWHLSTKKCLDASRSIWIKNKSFQTLFEEAMYRKFNFDDLDKNLCYLFVLVHYKNKNIVNHRTNYKNNGNNGNNYDYKKIYLIAATIKHTYKEDMDATVPGVERPKEYNFDSIATLVNKLTEHNDRDVARKTITWEGYILKIYEGTKDSKFHLAKLQTKIYQYILSYKPNLSNIYKVYLELYKIDKLNELLPYFYKGKNSITQQIHESMRVLTKEFLELYHLTRNKKNIEVYNLLPKMYKKVLYDLHGIYIKNKDNKTGNPINIYNVYNYLKTMDIAQLCEVFTERQGLLGTDISKYLDKVTMDIKVYTNLLLAC